MSTKYNKRSGILSFFDNGVRFKRSKIGHPKRRIRHIKSQMKFFSGEKFKWRYFASKQRDVVRQMNY